MPNDEERTLTVVIEELRRMYDCVGSDFESLRTKALALLAGEVAIVTFLFSTDTIGNKGFSVPLTPAYGAILFAFGCILLLTAFVLFLTVVATVRWTHPPTEKDIIDLKDRFDNDPVRFLRYLKNDYIGAINHCVGKINGRARRFMIAVYAFSIGVFMLILIKYGG